ncbi:MAG TPA: prepilin-type N-terminal cleavage/methylation domain-containing protein [Candidatus Paceibacterota bacterium]|nr:prepilin-type N-terminal cleavage/methylation domain-containing protein [Candidatus Paceibacterota bacterium]
MRNSKAGFTILEILMVVVILAILVGISYTAFNNLNSSEALDTETNTILSMIERARERTISSENSIEYGVHFASTTAVLFVGKTYSAGSSTSETKNINSKVKVNSINLTGGVADIYFNKLSGKPSATGTIVFSLLSSTSSVKTITIYNTGLSDVK